MQGLENRTGRPQTVSKWYAQPVCLNSFLKRNKFLSLYLSVCLSLLSSLYLWHGWNHQHVPPCPGYWLRWGLAHFLSRLDSNCDPPE
jgi:hypothetical protein